MDSPANTADEPLPSIEDVEVLGRSDIAGSTMDEGKGRVFPCEGCGADLTFHIGEQQLKCPFCGYVKEIEIREDAEIREQDFHAMLERLARLKEAGVELEIAGASEVRCGSCGGNVVFTGTLTSTDCPYCGSPIQREKIHSATQRIPVDAVLPFLIDHDAAATALAEWVESRWFAPNAFRRDGVNGKFNGVYLPYWTYDTLTFNAYRGERGENYTVTVGTGKNRRTETRTRWYPASGQFQRFFDDVMVIASAGLPMGHIQELEPWPLAKAIPFTQQVLAGILARTYDVPLDAGFTQAKVRIDAALHTDVCRRIGGDKQRVHSIKTRCDAITFKHLLLPVWMMAYRFHDKPFQIFINAGTGEVQGDRPYSWVKITLAVLAGMALVGTLIAFFASR
jgi:predicted RNA-binding Zn-ribbon protein involved in translation (DUF1610 family)